MNNGTARGLENLIKEYIEFKQGSILSGKKKNDAEKEYNKLLTSYNGESKQYTLDQADRIYKAYLGMIACSEESKQAETRLDEAEKKLNEVGRILFEASITAEILVPPVNGGLPSLKNVTVSYNNGQVMVI